MKRFHKFVIPAAALMACGLLLQSCSDDNPWTNEGTEGRISLNLSASSEVIRAVPRITRAESQAPDVPSADDFSITLSRIDGSWSQTYASLAEFNAVGTFKTGAYKLSANYGSLDNEGFEKPHYAGETQLTVLEDRTSEVSVTTTVASALVSLNYTSAFRQYFESWSAKVHTQGHDYIDFTSAETRPAYITPGTTEVSIEITDHSGRTVNLSPCNFESLGRHHYNITFDVNNGQVGIASLTVSFDDEMTREDVTIDLTEELFTTPAPVITTTGITNGGEIESIFGDTSTTPATMTILARGGLASAVMTFQSTTFTPPFGTETELCNASASLIDQLNQMGIEAKGLSHPDQIAYIDFTKFAAHLPVGTHTITLLAKDAVDRASDPVSFTFSVQQVELESTPEPTQFGNWDASLIVDYNGADPSTDLGFKALNDLGQYVDAPILQISEIATTRAISTKRYQVRVQLPQTERCHIPVIMYRHGEKKAEFNVDVILPEYDIEIDPHANFAVIKLTAKDSTPVAELVNHLCTTISGPNATGCSKQSDPSTGCITLLGLKSNSDYTLIHSLASDADKNSISFHTEAETQLPNSDFSSTHDIWSTTIQVGGPFGAAILGQSYTIKGTLTVTEPTGWATINAKTAYQGSTALNSWFVVPSTLATDGKVKIRSVAYDHNGKDKVLSRTSSAATYYCEKAPSSISDRAAGELFLGSYSFNGTETRQEGISFASRPTSLSFDYSYDSKNNEQGIATIEILDASGNVIASGTKNLTSSPTMTTARIDLPAYPFGKKASTVRVKFKSSNTDTPYTYIPTGKELNEGCSAGQYTLKTPNNFKAVSTGSELFIDNLALGYQSSQAAKTNTRKTSNRRK